MKHSLVALHTLALAAGVLAYDYPPIPKDLTTPSQQRLAVHGSNGKRHLVDFQKQFGADTFLSGVRGLEHLCAVESHLCSLWHFRQRLV
jgi:hypothetical protein